MDFIGLLRTLERVTRPAGHDDDRPLDEELWRVPRCNCCGHPTATELLKSGDDGESWCCPDCVTEALASEAEWRAINDDEDAPNPTDPGLTPDELVGVRGLLQERYNPNFAGAAASLAGGVSHSQPVREDKQQEPMEPADPHKSSASNHAGAESAPSPTIVQSAPPPTVDGEGGGGELHSPGARLPHPDDAVAEWIGEAVPVISEMLAAHVPHERSPDHYVECVDPHGTHDFGVDDWPAWRAHVGPLIAEALAPQQKADKRVRPSGTRRRCQECAASLSYTERDGGYWYHSGSGRTECYRDPQHTETATPK